MSELGDLQRAFQGYLLGQADVPDFSARVVGADEASAQERLGVYHEAYRLRLIEALEADFTTLKAALDEAPFQTVALAYIAAHPSQHPSIRWFGRNLEAFLRAAPPWAEYRVIGDIAALDWAISLAFDAPDGPVLTEADLVQIPGEAWANLRFTLHPSVHTCDLDWNVGPLRLAADAGEPVPEAERAPAPVRWLVWRAELQASFRSMNVEEAFSLDAAGGGATFAEICEGLCEWVDAEHAAMHAAGLLRQWVNEGLLGEVLIAQ